MRTTTRVLEPQSVAGATVRADRGRGPIRSLAGIVVVALLLGFLSLLGAGSSSAAAPAAPFLGTLGTNPSTAQSEAIAGVKVGMVELQWRSYETSNGVFSTNYKNIVMARVAAMRSAGMKVTLSLGLHFTPAWAMSMPNGHFVNEDGAVSSEGDFVFNNNLRIEAQQYLAQVNTWLPFSGVWAVRINSGAESELLYPGGGHYWAFGPNAQNGAAMPATMTRNPFPGWKPGTAGLTTAQVSTWEKWYIGALANEARWQINAVKALGFTGYNQVLTPGTGIYDRKIAGLVAQNLPDGVLGVGAVWSQIYADLAGLPHVVAYITSVGDGSGGNTSCAATDSGQAINGPDTVWWGSTRWIAHVAAVNGIQVAGENPGYPTAAAAQAHYKDASASGTMAVAMRLATSCGFQGIYWAHDDQFYNGTVPFSQFAAYSTPGALTPQNAQ